jgi:flagellar biosynthesis protein FliR
MLGGFQSGAFQTNYQQYGAVKSVGRIVTNPKTLGATAGLFPAFDFTSAMSVSETILSASVAVSVYTGVDPSPSAILSGAATVSGKVVSQVLTGGVVGVVYALTCTAVTSLGQVLQLMTYFYVEPNLP